tara:strand:+ start:455 stop:667 length:213 start_codon:yes stop_codon:yes gene_type:complete
MIPKEQIMYFCQELEKQAGPVPPGTAILQALKPFKKEIGVGAVGVLGGTQLSKVNRDRKMGREMRMAQER